MFRAERFVLLLRLHVVLGSTWPLGILYTPELSEDREGDLDFQADLWEGMDSADYSVPTSAMNFTLLREVGFNDERFGVQIMGLQDTGTNLLMAMLQLNFGDQVRYFDAAFHNPTGTHSKGIWKHANVHMFREVYPDKLQTFGEQRVVALALVRDPMSWLQSIRKAPYELKSCVTGDDWLRRACTHSFPAGYNDVPGATLPNLESVWGQWTKAYDELVPGGYHGAIMIRYEDLVLHPEATMGVVAEKLGLNMPKVVKYPTEPAKGHGDAIGRNDAMVKIQTRAFMSLYPEGEVAEVCERLESFQSVMEAYGYSCWPQQGPEKVSFRQGREKKLTYRLVRLNGAL
eukprot:CAMPEP_0170600192 /NCGR_PEP_ID=MMETSP0224-20130122/17206_1 /TAXON_ID=285029 /ORGANISM="Togula jolla, Strain CCCM 725" /LENGTH=343 /DNA_ID=CAMNT_0010924907 /DNA_START=38 /DNA_END=1069 /DNA_ORIENTATION=+